MNNYPVSLIINNYFEAPNGVIAQKSNFQLSLASKPPPNQFFQ